MDDLREGLFQALERLGPRQRVLAIPPDFTRFHSHAGEQGAFFKNIAKEFRFFA